MKRVLLKIFISCIFISFFPLYAQNNNTLLNISTSPEVQNLYYSQRTKCFYFSIPSNYSEKSELYSPRVNLMEKRNPAASIYSDKTGFYIKSKDKDSPILRISCPQTKTVQEKARRLIRFAENPNYDLFFSYLYSFADYGTDPIFATQTKDGEWIFEEAALKYLTGYHNHNKYDDNFEHFFGNYTDQNVRFKLEKLLFDKNKGFDNPVPAFSYNGHPEALENIRTIFVDEGFFIDTIYGIWYIKKNSDGSAHFSYFLTTDNKLNIVPIDELNKLKITYSASEVSDCINQYQIANSTQVKHEKLISKLLLIISIILALLLLIPRLIHFINQQNPSKRKYTFTQKAFNRKIFNIQEAERQKISRDIHDTVIQDIRVLGIEGELLKLPDGDSENLEHKNKIQSIATDCIIKLRNICYNLAPAELSGHTEDDSSKVQLISMLNTLSSQFTIRTHIPCSVKVKDDFNYPPFEHEVSENLFRVVQEALTNVEKHSYATAVSIFIKSKIIEEKEYLIIYISDDGVGCDTKKMNLKNDIHRGLRNMKERMELIGGKIEFFSKPNEGLEITLTIEVK